MQMMSVNLEAAAGNRMKHILERLTANRFLGVCVGAVITAVIQSSSATTVMVVGFVNSGLMTLRQAVWIIMRYYRRSGNPVYRHGHDGGGHGSSAGIGYLCQSYDQVLESISGDFGGRCLYSDYPIILRIGWNSAGPGCQRPDWA